MTARTNTPAKPIPVRCRKAPLVSPRSYLVLAYVITVILAIAAVAVDVTFWRP